MMLKDDGLVQIKKKRNVKSSKLFRFIVSFFTLINSNNIKQK